MINFSTVLFPSLFFKICQTFTCPQKNLSTTLTPNYIALAFCYHTLFLFFLEPLSNLPFRLSRSICEEFFCLRRKIKKNKISLEREATLSTHARAQVCGIHVAMRNFFSFAHFTTQSSCIFIFNFLSISF